MNRTSSCKIALFFVGLFLAGCLGAQANSDEEYFQLASALTKLSKAVDFVVSFENPSIETTSPELLKLATSNDPSLLKPFEKYSLQVIRKDSSAIILVCTKDGEYAILEDVTCSSTLERHAWQESSTHDESPY